MFKSIMIQAWKCAVYLKALELFMGRDGMWKEASDAHAFASKVSDNSTSVFNGQAP